MLPAWSPRDHLGCRRSLLALDAHQSIDIWQAWRTPFFDGSLQHGGQRIDVLFLHNALDHGSAHTRHMHLGELCLLRAARHHQPNIRSV